MATSYAKKKVKKNIPAGIAHIQATFNNTIVTITDLNGQHRGLVVRRCAAVQGLPQEHALRRPAGRRGRRPQGDGPRHEATVGVFVKGPGTGRESALRAIANTGLKITHIKDVTPIPHNGCRPPKRRRV